MAYDDVILADAPLRYWPLNETSGTSANELVANEDAVASGMVLGGGDAPTGIGGKCPSFTGVGTEFITLRAAAVLGGLAAYTVEAWVRYTPTDAADTVARCFYGEIGTAGNDMIRGELDDGTASQHLRHVYGDDAATVTRSSGSVFVNAQWILMHLVRSGATGGTWWNAGERHAITDFPAGATWTNAGIAARLGVGRAGVNPWKGQIARVAVYNRVLTEAEMLEHFEAGTPLIRELTTRSFWVPDKAVWNQRLDDPANVPTIASNSATTVTRLVNQVATYGTGINAGGGPFYIVDNTTPTQRVRLEGGENNVSYDKPALYNAFGAVPIPPAGFHPNTSTTDLQTQVYNKDTDELWEFWIMQQTLLRPEWASAVVSGAGTIPAGTYLYGIAPTAGGAQYGTARQAAGSCAVDGTQGAQVTWGTSEDATNYQIWRRTSAESTWHLLTTVSAATHSFTDTGALTPGAPFTYNGATLGPTADWGCSYGGYMAATDETIGVYMPPRQNWGATATSLPMWGGTVSLMEAMDDEIPHALTMALPQVANSHVFPAQEHDYFGGANEIPEGTRFQLDPSFDTSTISNRFARMLAIAFQKYGGYIRDFAGAVTVAYVEDATDSGRNFYPYVLDGKQSYEVFAGFPWSSMRVVAPAWTQTQTLPAPVLIEALTDNFNTNVIDAGTWPTFTTAVESGGRLRLQPNLNVQANITSIGGAAGIRGPWSLLGSSVKAQIVQVGITSGDQSRMRIVSQLGANCRIEFLVETGLLKAQFIRNTSGTTVVASATYDPGAHAWWRISESGGIVSYEVSATGLSWSPFATLLWSTSTWPTTYLQDVVLQFTFQNFNSAPGPDLVVDNVNLATQGAPAIDLPTPLSLKPRVTTLALRSNVTEVVLDG